MKTVELIENERKHIIQHAQGRINEIDTVLTDWYRAKFPQSNTEDNHRQLAEERRMLEAIIEKIK